MPCNGDYLEPNDLEQSLSKVACLLDELKGKPKNESHWSGYHPMIYNKTLSKRFRDVLVRTLCNNLQNVDVTKYSLEMQMWWRDHQAADKARIQEEQKEKKKREERNAALAKLTPRERELLGL